jgi:hypothetical protein
MEREIVDNDVKMLMGMGLIQLFEERQEDVAVIAVHSAGFHCALVYCKSSQQTRSAVPGVGSRMPLGISGPERKYRLDSIQRLYVRFLVQAEDQRIFRRDSNTGQ